MLKCTMCGHVERCCYVLCPVCGERMVLLEDYDKEVGKARNGDQVGDPLYPEAMRTQCKVCGKRQPLYLVTDYRLGGGLTLGICRECYFSKDD
jgi:hypothetical protein